ncbi:MAG: hypothetical protein LBK63_04995 [Treponema sp.]|jgi:hypothetical protein|nr:hypothetical protein [Treponema sp.]
MKTILALFSGLFFGLFFGLVSVLLGSAVSAAILRLCVPPFLRIIDIPVLTARFGSLGYGGYFIFAFVVRMLVGLILPANAKPEKE